MHRAQLFRERSFILAARDRHRFEAHLHRELNSEMSESADPEYSDNLAGSRAAVPQCIECCHASTHEWGTIDGGKILRHRRKRFRWRDHIFGITAIERNAGGQQRHLASKEITAPAWIAVSAMSSMPTDANSLTRFPFRHARPNGVNDSDYFMSGHSWVLDTRPGSIFD